MNPSPINSGPVNPVTDAEVHKNVVDELTFEPSVDASKVSVAVRNGVVTLSGSVPTYTGKWAAEKAVKRVRGVGGVAEELTVVAYSDLTPSDTDTAEAARRALNWGMDKSQMEPHQSSLLLKVEKGWLTLEGQVEWQFQRQGAQGAVAHLNGVKGVSNLITLVPEPKTDEIHQQIEAAFRRSAELEADRVQISVKEGEVMLRGHLTNWTAIDAAALAAWKVLGVTAVHNQIMIGE